jgi:anti-sigma B factor antagonist
MTAPWGMSVHQGESADGRGRSLVVVLDGELDIAAAPLLADRLEELLAEGLSEIVVDVGPLAFADVASLRVLVALRARAARSSVTVRLSGASPPLRRMMRIVSPSWDFSAGAQRAVAAVPRPPDLEKLA